MQPKEPRLSESSAIGHSYLAGRVRVLVGNICHQDVARRLLTKAASGVLASLRGSPYAREYASASSLTAALLDGLSEQPAGYPGAVCDRDARRIFWTPQWFVNTLLGGGDGAIHEAGGPHILAECEALGRTRYPEGLSTGKAVITSGGLLPARFVIHTVAPVKGVHGDQDAVSLASCDTNSLALAVSHNLCTVAIPTISTGIYGYPREEAAAVASEAIMRCLKEDTVLTETRLVFFTKRDAQACVTHQRFSVDSIDG